MASDGRSGREMQHSLMKNLPTSSCIYGQILITIGYLKEYIIERAFFGLSEAGMGLGRRKQIICHIHFLNISHFPQISQIICEPTETTTDINIGIISSSITNSTSSITTSSSSTRRFVPITQAPKTKREGTKEQFKIKVKDENKTYTI